MNFNNKLALEKLKIINKISSEFPEHSISCFDYPFSTIIYDNQFNYTSVLIDEIKKYCNEMGVKDIVKINFLSLYSTDLTRTEQGKLETKTFLVITNKNQINEVYYYSFSEIK